VEVDATLYPQEASLEKLAVSFQKGCYLGQEVVYMLENRGHVKRKLVPLDLEGAAAALPAALTLVLDSPTLGEQLGRAGRRRVLDTYTWRATAERTAAWYAQTLERKGRPC
ncbi:MAG: hypothetical protein JHC71_19635, partial [Blastococcus sp.]|nr:hypothetical protein [Blastococcus sp.]